MFAVIMFVFSILSLRAQADNGQGLELAVLKDDSGRLTLRDILTIERSDPSRFKTLNAAYSGGYSSAAFWFRIRLDSAGKEKLLEVLPPFLDEVRLYSPDSGSARRYLERIAGDAYPVAARDFNGRGFVFRVGGFGHGKEVHYLRLTTTSSSILLLRLLEKDEYFSAVLPEITLHLLAIGAICAVMLVNLMTWWWSREPLTAWFMAYLLTLVLVQVGNNDLLPHLWLPDSPAYVDMHLKLWVIMNIAVTSKFYRQILRADEAGIFFKRLYQFMFWVPLLSVIPLLLGMYTPIMRFMSVVILLALPLGCYLAFKRMRSISEEGPFVFFGMLFSMMGTIALMLSNVGAVPSRFAMLHALNIGTVFSIFAMHIGLARRHRLQHEAQKRLTQIADQERQALKRRKDVLGFVAHDLRTPLSVIQTNADLLGLRLDDQKRAASLQGIRTAIGQLESLFGKALAVDADGTGFEENQHFSLDAMMKMICREQCELRGESEPILRLECDTGITLYGDQIVVRTIIENLLANAFKYTAEPESIHVALFRSSGTAVLRISNSTPVSTALTDKALFEKGVRGENCQGRSGSGMGLYLVKKLVEEMSGKVTVSQTAHGATHFFSVELVLPI